MDNITFTKVIFELIVVAALVIFELIIRRAKSQKKKNFDTKVKTIHTTRELEQLTLKHNKYKQFLDLTRMGVFFLAIFFSFLIYNIQAFSVFILGLGAIIISLKEIVASIFTYFYILTRYEVGDDINIDGKLGEINTIRPLATSVIGKEAWGEYNGKLINIPNYLFLQKTIEEQELKTGIFRRTTIIVSLKNSTGSLDAIVGNLRAFLENLLPIRSAEETGYFRNYAGKKYRLTLAYNDDGELTMRVAFVAKTDDITELREKIITYIETLRGKK